MIEGPIPQDITKHKAKFIANFSSRQVVCLVGAAFGGVGGYAGFLKGIENTDVRMFVSFLIALPFLLIGFVEVYEQPFEKIAPIIILENFLWPVWRKKETHFPNLEAYEKTRPWLVDTAQEEESDEGEENEDNDDSSSKKKKKSSKNKKKKPEKLKPASPSKNFREIR